jgi:hypothetical protein
MIELLNELKPTLSSILTVLISIWLGYRLGLLTYFQKKEHDQIIQRYLEQGVDLISSNIDHALTVFRENWSLSLTMLKEFHETNSANVPMRKESYNKKFIVYDAKSFSVSPYYKIKSLVGDDVFWESAQSLFAFVGNSYSFFENDLKLCIQTYYNPDVETASYDQIYESYLKQVINLNEESYKYYKIIMELQNLAVALETKPLSFKDILSLRNKPLSKLIVKRLRSEILDKVSEES